METNYNSLVQEYTVTKKELGVAESTIRRLTGRDPDDVANGSKFRPRERGERDRALSTGAKSYSGRKRSLNMSTGYDRKRPREKFPSERQSVKDAYISPEEEDESTKPTLQSTIVAKPSPARSRKALIADLDSSAKIKARNRRMFSNLIGTLERFQKEEQKRKFKKSMRAEIEQKVEEASTRDKEKLKLEKESLFATMREKKIKLRILEKKIERAESHDVYDSNNKAQQNFILTNAHPQLFYMPKSHTSASKKCYEETKTKLNELMDKKRDEFQSELNEIEELYKKDSVSSFKGRESNGAKEEVESQDVPETESESLVVEQEDSNPEEDESTNYRSLGSSLIDQEFEPIYD